MPVSEEKAFGGRSLMKLQRSVPRERPTRLPYQKGPTSPGQWPARAWQSVFAISIFHEQHWLSSPATI